jgi:hypothetical protein
MVVADGRKREREERKKLALYYIRMRETLTLILG